jgi:anti-anti-sigma regulatory factor
MLRITHDIDATTTGAILRLEGRVVGPWVDELRRACLEQHAAPHRPLTIDLGAVTFVDSAGIALFDEIFPTVTLINCSLFAVEQLRAVLERHGGVRT